MGAFSDFDAYRDSIKAPVFTLPLVKINHTIDPNRTRSKWTGIMDAGSAPGAAAACSRATPGAKSGLRATTASLYPVEFYVFSSQYLTSGVIIIADRLSHQSGLSGTVTTQQTTNLPTAALTRYTSGVGVMAALEAYTAVGTTGQTATLNYTNSDGTSGQTSRPLVIGGAADDGGVQFYPASLADGDIGVRSVEGVTLSGSTGAAGNFGVTLFRPLLAIPVNHQGGERAGPLNPGIGGLWAFPEFNDDACLMDLYISGIGADSGYFGYLRLGAA